VPCEATEYIHVCWSKLLCHVGLQSISMFVGVNCCAMGKKGFVPKNISRKVLITENPE
jgi:hypothetical protein